MEYTLSFYVKENQPYIVHPKWFESRRGAKLADNYVWVRKSCTVWAESSKEAQEFFNNQKLKEVLKQTNNLVKCLQLEIGGDESTNYIRTSEIK